MVYVYYGGLLKKVSDQLLGKDQKKKIIGPKRCRLHLFTGSQVQLCGLSSARSVSMMLIKTLG